MKQLTARETGDVVRRLEIGHSLGQAFGLVDPATDVRYTFHSHQRHQLIVPRDGVVTVESERRLLVAGPGQAVWIPARRRHATALRAARQASVFFDARVFASIARDVCLFAVPEVVGAMAEHAANTGPRGNPGRAFFAVLRALCARASRADAGPSLPRPRSGNLLRAVEAMLARLANPDFAEVARAAGMSARTLRRSFRAETGLAPRDYLNRARMLWAMQSLAGARAQSVLEVTLATGFNSPSAFTAAFRRCFGKTPSELRADVARAQPTSSPGRRPTRGGPGPQTAPLAADELAGPSTHARLGRPGRNRGVDA